MLTFAEYCLHRFEGVKLLTEASNIEGRARKFWDQGDIDFLYQFPSTKWSGAMQYRYGKYIYEVWKRIKAQELGVDQAIEQMSQFGDAEEIEQWVNEGTEGVLEYDFVPIRNERQTVLAFAKMNGNKLYHQLTANFGEEIKEDENKKHFSPEEKKRYFENGNGILGYYINFDINDDGNVKSSFETKAQFSTQMQAWKKMSSQGWFSSDDPEFENLPKIKGYRVLPRESIEKLNQEDNIERSKTLRKLLENTEYLKSRGIADPSKFGGIDAMVERLQFGMTQEGQRTYPVIENKKIKSTSSHIYVLAPSKAIDKDSVERYNALSKQDENNEKLDQELAKIIKDSIKLDPLDALLPANEKAFNASSNITGFDFNHMKQEYNPDPKAETTWDETDQKRFFIYRGNLNDYSGLIKKGIVIETDVPWNEDDDDVGFDKQSYAWWGIKDSVKAASRLNKSSHDAIEEEKIGYFVDLESKIKGVLGTPKFRSYFKAYEEYEEWRKLYGDLEDDDITDDYDKSLKKAKEKLKKAYQSAREEVKRFAKGITTKAIRKEFQLQSKMRTASSEAGSNVFDNIAKDTSKNDDEAPSGDDAGYDDFNFKTNGDPSRIAIKESGVQVPKNTSNRPQEVKLRYLSILYHLIKKNNSPAEVFKKITRYVPDEISISREEFDKAIKEPLVKLYPPETELEREELRNYFESKTRETGNKKAPITIAREEWWSQIESAYKGIGIKIGEDLTLGNPDLQVEKMCAEIFPIKQKAGDENPNAPQNTTDKMINKVGSTPLSGRVIKKYYSLAQVKMPNNSGLKVGEYIGVTPPPRQSPNNPWTFITFDGKKGNLPLDLIQGKVVKTVPVNGERFESQDINALKAAAQAAQAQVREHRIVHSIKWNNKIFY